ncbi:MAG: hypothetical protein QUV08_01115 [Parasphingorhabdus sp.]|nr:hypothetical protein [Parasphingorhabdus sp.]
MQMDGFGVEVIFEGRFPEFLAYANLNIISLAGPVQREFILPHDLATDEFGWLSSFDNSGFYIGSQITEANKLFQMTRGIRCDHGLWNIVDQMIPCRKGMRDEPEQYGIRLGSRRTLIGSNSEFPFVTSLYSLASTLNLCLTL